MAQIVILNQAYLTHHLIGSTCGIVPYHSDATTTIEVQDDVVIATVQCHIGHRFPDGELVMVTICRNINDITGYLGGWLPNELPICQRKFFINTNTTNSISALK